MDFGALADGVSNNAQAIQRAIDEAAVHGGQVIVPAGRFLSGTIRLKSNVDLHLEEGAVLVSSLNREDIIDFQALFRADASQTGFDGLQGGCFNLVQHGCTAIFFV